jgi:hypothetical protein
MGLLEENWDIPAYSAALDEEDESADVGFYDDESDLGEMSDQSTMLD